MNVNRLSDLSQRLQDVSRGRWRGLYMEYQDEGRLLFVSVEVDSLNVKEMEVIRSDLKTVLRRAMPDREDGYSWVAVVKRDGTVVESVMGGCTGLLPEI